MNAFVLLLQMVNLRFRISDKFSTLDHRGDSIFTSLQIEEMWPV